MNTVVLRPVITEKSMGDAGVGKYTFVVARRAKKSAIKQAIQKQFNVHVVSVITNVVKGKRQRSGQRRIESTLSFYKKATVTLKSGEKIGMFETTTQ